MDFAVFLSRYTKFALFFSSSRIRKREGRRFDYLEIVVVFYILMISTSFDCEKEIAVMFTTTPYFSLMFFGLVFLFVWVNFCFHPTKMLCHCCLLE